jgi:hypothetical protein
VSTIVLIDEFKDYVRDQVSVDDAVMQAALDGAEYSAEDYCKRILSAASGTPSARSFTPRTYGATVLDIDDCVSITSVVDNGTTIAAADYQKEPVNGLDRSGHAVPYRQLRLYTGFWTYDYGFARIVVTADWGWDVTAPTAVEAIKILAKDILQQRNNNSGVAGFGEFGAIRVRENPMVARMLNPLRRSEAFGFA